MRAWRAWRKKQATISDEHEHREPKSVNIFFGFFFLVNCSLGSGFLATPYSFLHTGYLVAIPTLLVIVFVTWIHASWVLEVMARAQVRWGWLFCDVFRHILGSDFFEDRGVNSHPSIAEMRPTCAAGNSALHLQQVVILLLYASELPILCMVFHPSLNKHGAEYR